MQLNPAQINFIVRMYVKDNPDKYKLTDTAIIKGEHPIQVLVANADKLLGKSKAEYDRNPVKYIKKYYGNGKN